MVCRIVIEDEGLFVRLKKCWTKPVIRPLNANLPDQVTPRQREAIELLVRRAREAVDAEE